jgi:hypothetical protein
MSGPTRFLDSTQIVLPVATLEDVRGEVESRFTVTIEARDRDARIIGSPAEIKDVNAFLVRNGVSLP